MKHSSIERTYVIDWCETPDGVKEEIREIIDDRSLGQDSFIDWERNMHHSETIDIDEPISLKNYQEFDYPNLLKFLLENDLDECMIKVSW